METMKTFYHKTKSGGVVGKTELISNGKEYSVTTYRCDAEHGRTKDLHNIAFLQSGNQVFPSYEDAKRYFDWVTE